MSDELLPCPMCPDGGDPARTMFNVLCRTCGLETSSENTYATDEQMVAVWNQRPIEDAIRAKLALAKKRLAKRTKMIDDILGSDDEVWDNWIETWDRVRTAEAKYDGRNKT